MRNPLKWTHWGSIFLVITDYNSLWRADYFTWLCFRCSRRQQKYVSRNVCHIKKEFHKDLKFSSILVLLSNVHINLNALILCWKIISCMDCNMISTTSVCHYYSTWNWVAEVLKVIHSLRLFNKYFQDSLNKNAWEVKVCSWNPF